MTKKQSITRGFLFGVALLAGVVSAGSALAQNWPTKPVTVIVPWPPGGPSDTAARPIAKGLHEALGQAFVIDNKGGAGGNIGSAQVAKSAADGYTLLITSSAPIVINPHVYKKMPYDPSKDLEPITNLLRVPLVLVVHPSVPAKVGTSGSNGERLALVTAIAFTLPALMCDTIATVLSNIIGTCPPSRSLIAGAEPL